MNLFEIMNELEMLGAQEQRKYLKVRCYWIGGLRAILEVFGC